jgi:hypothetical protein
VRTPTLAFEREMIMEIDRQAPTVLREVPVDWEALEDAFENNAPEVHSYLHLSTGEVLRVVDGVADPQMHSRISVDPNYLRIDPVSSREQYRWMERFIPMVDDSELQLKLAHAIDGKGAFRRFKDALMTYATERENWFTFRSERLRTFMEAWLAAHGIQAIARPAWLDAPPTSSDTALPESSAPGSPMSVVGIPSISGMDGAAGVAGVVGTEEGAPKSQSARRYRNAETLRQTLKELCEVLGQRELDLLAGFAEFLKARRAARSFAHHHEHMLAERTERAAASVRGVPAPSGSSPGLLRDES